MNLQFTIYNLQLKLKKILHSKFYILNSNGFTLIEALISISILGIVGLIAMNILSRTFQGSSKSSLIGDVKQNGEIALNILDKTIRTSDAMICSVSNSTESILAIYTKDGQYLRFKIVNQPVDKSYNGYIQEDMPQVTNPALANSSLCDFGAYPENQKYFLTDNNTQTGVSVISGNFTVNKNAGFKDLVNISFDLGPPIGTGFSFDQVLGGGNVVSFKTTVELR